VVIFPTPIAISSMAISVRTERRDTKSWKPRGTGEMGHLQNIFPSCLLADSHCYQNADNNRTDLTDFDI
jgi:hypothetical protein